MTKCKTCGRKKYEEKYVIRERFNYLIESFIKIPGLIFLAIITGEVWAVFLFIFLAGCLFATDLVFIGKAKTKKELTGGYSK